MNTIVTIIILIIVIIIGRLAGLPLAPALGLLRGGRAGLRPIITINIILIIDANQ